MMTLEEIKERLKEEDPWDLLEILDVSSDQLVERFDDVIEDMADYLEEKYQEEQDLLYGDRDDLV